MSHDAAPLPSGPSSGPSSGPILAPAPTPALPEGFRAAAVACGLKPAQPEERSLDLGLIVADRPCRAAAVFTTNKLLGAHVHLCRDHLQRSGGWVRAVLVNAKNANCATGERGMADARQLVEEVAGRLHCPVEQVLMMSTGPIGAPMPMAKLLPGLDPLLAQLGDEETRGVPTDQGLERFSRAIMTTDLVPKTARALAGDGSAVGVAKGSGMIHPDMATMLAFCLSDLPLGDDLQKTAQHVAEQSFHRISVDGDTSPNDTLLVWSSERVAGASTRDSRQALANVAVELARRVAADGEGASRLVTVQVRGARTERDATHVGRLISTSPLTKTAIAGGDPNWGRILSVAGRAGVPMDADGARVWVGSETVYDEGRPWPEREPAAAAHLRSEREVIIGIDLGVGEAQADCWTCDLTADYVRINADYRS